MQQKETHKNIKTRRNKKESPDSEAKTYITDKY